MHQWLVAAAILIVGLFLLPMQMRSIGRWRKGRSGAIFTSFADGLATALDPRRATIVAEMEKRQK